MNKKTKDRLQVAVGVIVLYTIAALLFFGIKWYSDNHYNPKPTTEDIRQEASDEGYAAGEDEGYEKGKDAGWDEGYNQGYDEGYDKGVDDALMELQDSP